MVEVQFAVRKDDFKDHPSVMKELDLVEEEDQFTHPLTLTEDYDPEDLLSKTNLPLQHRWVISTADIRIFF